MSLEEFFLAPPTLDNHIPVVSKEYDAMFAELMGESFVNNLNEYDDNLKVFSDKLSREFDGMCDVFLDQVRQASDQGKAKARLCIAELAFSNFD